MEKITTLKSNRLSLLSIALVFLLPVVCAYFAFKGQWFELAATNKGELLEPVFRIESNQLPESLKGKWLVIIPADANCVKVCSESLYLAEQTDMALGKESGRVEQVRYFIDKTLVEDVHTLGRANLDMPKLITGFVYIADPLGQIILRYPVATDRQSNILIAKHILSDLQKLLKLSRVG